MTKRERQMPKGRWVGLLKKRAGAQAQLRRGEKADAARRAAEVEAWLKSR